MECPQGLEKVISSLRNVVSTGGICLDNAKKLSEDVNTLLTSENGVLHLKQHSKDFEVVLPVFIRIIFNSDHDVAHPSLKHCDVVFDIFWSNLPKIKKEGWWKQFETKTLLGLVDSLKSRVEANDDSWVTIWKFVANLVITDKLDVATLNKLLAVTEHAFKKGRERAEIKDKAWVCWKGLIDAFGRSPQILVLNRAINLLLKPLLTLSQASSIQISTWVHLLVVKGLSGPVDVVKSIVDPMMKSMYKSGEKSASRHLPDDCTNALIVILSHDHVLKHCLSDVIDIFAACVNSRPSAGLIEQLAGIIVKSINDMKDDVGSYRLWKALEEQYSSCSESPILSQACQHIFTDVNFARWVDSSTIEGKEIAQLMDSFEFRDKVLLRSIKSLTFDEQAETPTKKKFRKGSWEEVWSNYCEAYISWLSNFSLQSPNQNEKPESLKDSSDHQAVQFLLLQPVQLNIWNSTVCKTWFLLCEACHIKKLLSTFVKGIFDALDEPNFQLQKAINVSDILYKLDNSFCKQSAKLLDTISSVIFYMEFQNLLDVLSLSEIAVLFPEMSSVLCKICKNALEKSADYDQLNAHKIKTKVSKIMRKLEQHSNSAEKEKPPKAQRAPFRAQSNFLLRLAKAEERNKTKSPFLTTIFSSSEKVKTENDEDAQNDATAPMDMDTSQENGVVTDENKKPINHLDDSETVPIITLPSLLKSTPENGHTDGMVAEKENVILSTISGANTTSSLTICSPKMKITNAREVKTVDASSPAVSKKPKPVAGQKSTPKKVTPSKVSYFDDDANDCVMVPPKPKTTPLTEHQMEMMSKRRTDIPALYQDLSQDTQSQQVAVIQEVTSGVSPRPIQESQDIVLGTPSPEDLPAASTPEHRKPAGKTYASAKKLDFSHLSTPPSKTNVMNGSFHEMSPTPEHLKPEGDKCVKLVGGLPSTKSEESKNAEPLSDDISNSTKLQTNSNEIDDMKEDCQPALEEKSKRKRKSEPAKFSPKLTRSKRSLKGRTSMSTFDGKLTKLPEPDSKVQLGIKSADPSEKLARSVSPESNAKMLSVKVTDARDHGEKSARPKSPEPILKMLGAKLPDILDPSAKLARSKSPEPTAKKLNVKVPGTPERLVRSKSPEPASKRSEGVTNVVKTDDTKSTTEITQSNGSQESFELSSQRAEEFELSSQDKPKKSRKRKIVESSNDETPKKKKPSEEDVSSAAKKSDPAKKKKKPFRLGAGGNLENWLVKTDRVPTPVLEPEMKIENMELASESEKAGSESLPNDSVVDLDNSEEIVPSTQECLMKHHTALLPVLETKTDENSHDKEVVVEVGEEYPSFAVPDDADNRSPEKPEGSVLERLSHESPNDDDIALVISPSTRQKRAPSVFRGEGDTYLSKEKFYVTANEEPEDDSKVTPRAKKTASPTSRKRLQPLGGRSAKMLRLATSTSAQEGNDDIVVTPIRRRESIAPVKYGENWPKGPIEDWVACTPASPYLSPFRSALKKTAGPEENMTPQRGKTDSMSPLLSSAKRKRVVFLDPPVTRGLAYDMDSPGGSIHHADVPQGSPYPTWKGEDDRKRGFVDEDKMEISPSKRDVERLKSLADLNAGSVLREDVEGASPSKHGKGRPESRTDLKPYTSTDVSDEVRQLIDPPEPTTIVPSPEPDMNDFQKKFKLSDAFMATLSVTEPHIRSLLMQCFDCSNMAETVDAWEFRDCRRVCQMPHSFLVSVKNLREEVLTDILASGVFTAPTNKVPPEFSESSAQTDQRVQNSSQTQTAVFKESNTQTEIETASVHTATTEVATSTVSTQVDAALKLPSVDDWPSIAEGISHQGALLYISDSLRILASLPNK